MKLRHKYLNPIAVYLIVYTFGLLLFGFSLELTEWIYAYLNHLMPGIFPLYNPIHDPEAHARINKILTVTGLFVALFLISLIALKLENRKYERMIMLTDGQYLLKDGISLYFTEFLKTDLVTYALLPGIITLGTYFVPKAALNYFALIVPCWLGYHTSLLFGPVLSVITVVCFSLLGRLLSIPLCVRSWRAAWLSDI